MRRSRGLVLRAGVVAGVLSLAGCDGATGPSGPPGSDAMMTHDAALVAVDAVQQELELMTVPGGAASPNRTVTFLDASGKAQDRYDSLTTASIRTHFVLDHEAARTGWTASIHRASDMTVSGLVGRETTRTWNGTSTGKVSRSGHTDAGGTRTYEMTETETVVGVVRSVDHTAHPWPLSGSVRRTAKVTAAGGPNGGGTKDVTSVIVFNGTQHATLTVNGVAHDVDLANRRGALPFRRK